MHEVIFLEETDTDVVFKCVRCEKLIGFNKPGVGEPSPTLKDGTWVPPKGFEIYMDPCQEA